MLNKSNPFRYICIAGVFILLTVILSGCAMHDKVLDNQVYSIIECINTNKPDKLYQMFYPDGTHTKEETYAWFQKVKSIWKPISSDSISLESITVKEVTRNNEKEKTYQGVYNFDYEDTDYSLTIYYLETENARGITHLQFVESLTGGTLLVFAVALSVITAIFLLYTIIDIVRNKPHRYELWIVITLCLIIPIPVSGTGFAIPLGCIIYWRKRKRFLHPLAN